MAQVHFEPYSAIKYVGTKAKVFSTSLARPKPVLKKGDIVVVDKKTAFNLVHKGFGEFVSVDEISFTKKDKETQEEIEWLQEHLDAYKNENNELFAKLVKVESTKDSE